MAQCRGVHLLSKIVSQKEYLATNAFGVTATVSEINRDDYVLIVEDDHVKPSRNLRSNALSMSIPMSPDDARAAKTDVAVVLIVSVDRTLNQ